MKAAIVGTGRMGKAIAWAMDKLGCTELVLVDSVMDNLSACAEGLSCSTESILSDVQEPNPAFLKDSDIVISSLPYYHNEKLARYCIDHDLPYCDLGGHVGTSHNINEYAKSKDSVVMTDLGLAPGWVNILAEHGYNSHEGTPKTVDMMVGGLPIKPDNYLKYNCTWSHEGLINEYKDQCTVLTDGSIVLADGMSGLINIQTGLGVMEAFYTSGGASHTIETMQNRGVQDCNYRTIRHKGHCEALKFLINDCGLDDEGLIALLNTACPPAPDLVIVKVRVGAYKNIADWKEEKIVYSNDKFSAMQMATAFPISVVAQQMGISNLTRKIHLAQTHLIATNYYTRQGCYKFGGPLAYKDIPYEEFETKLEYLFEEAQ